MWRKFLVEMRKFAIVASFLFFFFGAFATYRRLILSEYQIDYFQYGYALIQALVLGKVVLIGEIFQLGERFHGKPLIFPTLYKTFSFSILVLVFRRAGTLRQGFYSRGTYWSYHWEPCGQGWSGHHGKNTRDVHCVHTDVCDFGDRESLWRGQALRIVL